MAKILIIEDEPEIAALERDYLTMAGFEADIKPDGIAGLDTAKSDGYDLIILDLMLPGLDGFSILKKLRKLIDIPVIIVSAKSDDIDKIRGFGLGADDYMQKPFSPSELVARVRAHLTRYDRLTSKSGRKTVITVRELSIDKEDRRVTVREDEKPLTPKEFDILLFLAENPNRVFTKDELFERVWGIESLGDSDTVVVHVRRLREKIEPDPQSPRFIETVWGAGYRFRV